MLDYSDSLSSSLTSVIRSHYLTSVYRLMIALSFLALHAVLPFMQRFLAKLSQLKYCYMWCNLCKHALMYYILQSCTYCWYKPNVEAEQEHLLHHNQHALLACQPLYTGHIALQGHHLMYRSSLSSGGWPDQAWGYRQPPRAAPEYCSRL